MRTKVKNFFELNQPYKFEMNDVRCIITIVNVVLIMIFGLSISWFSLVVALCGVVKDLIKDRHINGLLMHLSSVVLNGYFLYLYYMGV